MSGCAVCGSRTASPRAREGAYVLMQCGCGGMFLDPEPPRGAIDLTFDPHPEDYYANAAGLRAAWVAKRVPERGIFVEVGAGTHHLLAAARRHGFDVEGIELDPGRAARVARTLGVAVEPTALEHSERAAASCHVIYHCDMLSHFEDPKGALVRMRTMLRPRGYMAFEVGLIGDLAPHWYEAGPLRLPHHRWFYSEYALRSLLAQTGFAVVDLRRFGLGPTFRLSQLAGQLRLGGGATRSKIYSGALGYYLDPSTAKRENTTSRGIAARLRARAYMLARYRLGMLVPHYGPASVFVLARIA